jgi:hypothetical protein
MVRGMKMKGQMGGERLGSDEGQGEDEVLG